MLIVYIGTKIRVNDDPKIITGFSVQFYENRAPRTFVEVEEQKEGKKEWYSLDEMGEGFVGNGLFIIDNPEMSRVTQLEGE